MARLVILIGYGYVAGFNVGGRGTATSNIRTTILGVSKKRTVAVAGIRYSRGGREASATSVKGASICTSDFKAVVKHSLTIPRSKPDCGQSGDSFLGRS
jgi:hypothetical protein